MQTVVVKLQRVGKSADYLVLVGDQKTYGGICCLKQDYGAELDWLIPFIGHWHLLSNYQSVLMNVCYDASLKGLVQYAGHRGETLDLNKKSAQVSRKFISFCFKHGKRCIDIYSNCLPGRTTMKASFQIYYHQ